ncbi:MAG: peptidoglycan editing factor PgeF [Alphaproteobacteria bacterium]
MINPISHHLLQDVKHGFFTRQGGVSSGLYQGLNMGLGSNDDKDNVLQNRKIVADYFGSNDILTCFQVHSNKVAVIDSPDKVWDYKNAPEKDAIVCNVKGVAIGALSADCSPILFADIENQIIGCAHAGWRGAKDNIMKNVVDEMVNLGADRKNTVAVVGPLIAKQSYEVGSEFYDNFMDDSKDNNKYFSANNNSYQFDLNGFVVDCLKDLNIGAVDSIYNSNNTDTYADESMFYSFRRSTHKKENDYGRQISAICL